MPWFHKTPKLAPILFPKRIWKKDTPQVYLTFDDGPVPGVTDFVLNELAKRGQKATFFVVGDNVKKHTELATNLIQEGHGIGNHTFNHLFGIKYTSETYLENVQKCDEILENRLGVKVGLFRPPYGWMTNTQARKVSQTHQIVMWDVLSADYDPKLSASQILSISKKHTEPGSIVLFHDQEKTQQVLPAFLPDFLDYVLDQGWETASL
ncbi:polysaccharide deacetylase family protein [Algoriphagus sp. NBT04N3]|jgi:peptidoglycan-N-acetylglucosamine deacetylase|uniref:polysaccharide deacetylase family protein n=1 Tax=Algoriphagus sp. NBT04N3 TaxID=2705473 RepID=UPI001C62CE34|nr:polysaccharide deacetylase family protein [Algoriphagus sp. NBT04N3]QYH39697.1 polysaccharide deacetylase family protein [Algoriphagus sp. NBT04N3]